jgi:hypothetical protein
MASGSQFKHSDYFRIGLKESRNPKKRRLFELCGVDESLFIFRIVEQMKQSVRRYRAGVESRNVCGRVPVCNEVWDGEEHDPSIEG